jgi:hypothetical protein
MVEPLSGVLRYLNRSFAAKFVVSRERDKLRSQGRSRRIAIRPR